MEDSNVNDLKI